MPLQQVVVKCLACDKRQKTTLWMMAVIAALFAADIIIHLVQWYSHCRMFLELFR